MFSLGDAARVLASMSLALRGLGLGRDFFLEVLAELGSVVSTDQDTLVALLLFNTATAGFVAFERVNLAGGHEMLIVKEISGTLGAHNADHVGGHLD